MQSVIAAVKYRNHLLVAKDVVIANPKVSETCCTQPPVPATPVAAPVAALRRTLGAPLPSTCPTAAEWVMRGAHFAQRAARSAEERTAQFPPLGLGGSCLERLGAARHIC